MGSTEILLQTSLQLEKTRLHPHLELFRVPVTPLLISARLISTLSATCKPAALCSLGEHEPVNRQEQRGHNMRVVGVACLLGESGCW